MKINKLNLLGIGPKIGRITLLWFAVSIFISLKFKSSFVYLQDKSKIIFFCGLCLTVIGTMLYFLTLPSLLRGLKEIMLIKIYQKEELFVFCLFILFVFSIYTIIISRYPI